MARGQKKPTTVGARQAILTDEEIARELNRRHNTTRNNTKNVAACRWNAEQKLRRLLSDLATT